jgi:hypothetical protein
VKMRDVGREANERDEKLDPHAPVLASRGAFVSASGAARVTTQRVRGRADARDVRGAMRAMPRAGATANAPSAEVDDITRVGGVRETARSRDWRRPSREIVAVRRNNCQQSVPEFAPDNDCAPQCASRTRSRPSMLEAKTPASAWKPCRADGEEEAADPAAVDDDVGASMVKGRAPGEAREMPTSTPLPVPEVSPDDSARNSDAPRVSPPGACETAWWGEDLAARREEARGDPEAAMRDALSASFSGAQKNDRQNVPSDHHLVHAPFSAARTSRGRIAGDGAVRCFACGGEYTRNEMVVLSRCGHPLCVECAESFAEKRGARCATCKKIFDGWHFGVLTKSKDGSFAAWKVAFRALKPEPDADANEEVCAKKRKPARSARALAFDGVAGGGDGDGDGDGDGARLYGASSENENAARSGGSGKRRKPNVSPPEATLSPTHVSPGDPYPSLEPELNDADEDELLAAMREAGGASFQTPAAGKSSANLASR